MKKRKLHIGLSSIDKLNKTFIETWKNAEGGQVKEAAFENIYFAEIETLITTLSSKRLELLRELQQHAGISTYALAKQLHRDYKNVYTDVAMLKDIGLIIEDKGLSVPFRKIHAEIDLAA